MNQPLITNSKKIPVKRYNLGLPDVTYQQVEAISRLQGLTVLNVLIRFIKLGVFIYKTICAGDKVLIRKKGLDDKEILFVH